MRKGAEKLQKHLHSKQQGRLDGFFTVKPKEKAPPTKEKGKAGAKRKVCLVDLSVLCIVLTPDFRVIIKLKVVTKSRERSEQPDFPVFEVLLSSFVFAVFL